MILPYQEIKKLCESKNPMIWPTTEKSKAFGMSYGFSEAGYDIRIAQDITLYPLSLYNLFLTSFGFNRPNFSLASSIESFNIPNDIMFKVMDKSTWARRGLALQTTCGEPGWHGKSLTLELSYHGKNILNIKAGCPIAQIIFMRLTEPTEKPYNGKYNGQKFGPQSAILD